jgi:hypothetical protein
MDRPGNFDRILELVERQLPDAVLVDKDALGSAPVAKGAYLLAMHLSGPREAVMGRTRCRL